MLRPTIYKKNQKRKSFTKILIRLRLLKQMSQIWQIGKNYRLYLINPIFKMSKIIFHPIYKIQSCKSFRNWKMVTYSLILKNIVMIFRRKSKRNKPSRRWYFIRKEIDSFKKVKEKPMTASTQIDPCTLKVSVIIVITNLDDKLWRQHAAIQKKSHIVEKCVLPAIKDGKTCGLK